MSRRHHRSRPPLARLVASLFVYAVSANADTAYHWTASRAGEDTASHRTLETRFSPPDGFERIRVSTTSFPSWLRGLPLKAPGSFVRLYNGFPKLNQTAHAAIIDIDVGTRDLQQCADAVIRLRAEYLFDAGCQSDIVFRFTNGTPAAWDRWRRGDRPSVRGNRVTWEPTTHVDGSYQSFRNYLDSVFTYAGSLSLAKEMRPVEDPALVEAGDVFIQGGSPGHAVLVVDVAVDSNGRRKMLLAQSYMPAQEIHVLRNPAGESPWYDAQSKGPLITPEWEFDYADLRRFQDRCRPAGGSMQRDASSK